MSCYGNYFKNGSLWYCKPPMMGFYSEEELTKRKKRLLSKNQAVVNGLVAQEPLANTDVANPPGRGLDV